MFFSRLFDSRLAARLEHSGRRKSSKVNVGVPESSSEDGNDSSPNSPRSPPGPPVGGFREETISKEKQKFFRLNSFYGIKGRGREMCKAEGRPVRDTSSSSNSSTSDSCSSDAETPPRRRVVAVPTNHHPSPPPKTSNVVNTCNGANNSNNSTSKLTASASNREATPDQGGVVVNGDPEGDAAVVEPFSSFGRFGQCITFEDLAKKYQERAGGATVGRAAPEQLPQQCNRSSSWLQKLKSSADAKCSSSSKGDQVGGLLPTHGEPTSGPAGDEKRVVAKDGGEPSADSWHNLIKPGSSSIRMQRRASAAAAADKTPPSADGDRRAAEQEHADEELWGFAAAAARKKVAPVLHLVKEGAPTCYPSYNVFLSGLWHKNALKNAANKEAAAACKRSEAADVASTEALLDDADVSEALPLSLSPSKLVKSAVISKQYEHVRRNMLSSNSPFFYVNQLGDVVPSDKETIRKKLIAEATKTRHFQVCRHLNHLSVQPVSVPPPRPYNLSGKRITSYLSKKKKKKKIT